MSFSAQIHVKRKISAAIIESIRRHFRDAKQEEKSVDRIRNDVELVSGQTTKRFRSAQLTWVLHRVTRLRGDWHKTMNMVLERRRLLDTYLLEDDESSSKPVAGRVRKVMRHSESLPVSDPFPISNP